MGGRIFSGQSHDFRTPLISCSDRSPPCCHSGHPCIRSGFARERCLTQFSGLFIVSQPCVFAQFLHPAVNLPILKIEEEREIYKNISRFLSPSQPSFKSNCLHTQIRIKNRASACLESPLPCNYFQVVLTWFEKCLKSRIIFMY